MEKLRLEDLKIRISQSDKKAFKILFQAFYAKLLNYAFVIVKNHETAEDIVLEVFNTLWQKRTSLQSIARLDSYLYTCTKNKTIDFHRKNAKMMQVGFDDPCYREFISHQNPEKRLLNQELFDILDQAILDLPEKTRLVYRLIKEDGLKYQEVADLLGTSVKTVNNQLIQAVKVVRKHVSEYLNEETTSKGIQTKRSFLR